MPSTSKPSDAAASTERISLRALRERRHSWWDVRPGVGAFEQDETEAIQALCDVVEAAEEFIEARWLGTRERLEKAVGRFDFDV